MTDQPADSQERLDHRHRCPRCGDDLWPVMYGLPPLPIPDGVLIGGCVIDADYPTHGCPSCQWRGRLTGDPAASSSNP